MSYTKYADVAKASKDLLNKPYPETHKVELKAAAANGVTFTTEAILGPAPAAKGKKPTPVLAVKGEGVVSGNFKVDKLGVDTNNDLTGEFSLAEVVKGTKLTFKATDGTRGTAAKDPISATVGVEHRAPFGTFTVDVEALKQSVDVTGVVGFDNFLVGGAVAVARGDGGAVGLTNYSALVGFKNKDVAASVDGQKKFTSFVASYHQVVSPALSVAAQATIPRAAGGDDKLTLAAGVQYKQSPEVTLAGKATHAGKVAISYAQQLSALTKVTIGAEIDATKITSDSAHKLAIAVNFSA